MSLDRTKLKLNLPIDRTKLTLDGEAGLKSDELEANWAEYIRRKEQQAQQLSYKRRRLWRDNLERKKLRMLNRKWWQFWI